MTKTKIYDKFQNWTPTWWEKLLLPFVKTQMSVDIGRGNSKTTWVAFKVFRGKIYITGTHHE